MAQLSIQQAFDLALQHHRTGRLREAEQLYREILAQQPENADALYLLGLIAHQTGRSDVAVDLIRRSIALNPNNAEAHYNLGNALKSNGRLDEAIVSYRRAIALNPKFAEAHGNLGNALKDSKQLDEAIVFYRRAIALKPNFPEAYYNLGIALNDTGQLDEAIAAYRQAISFNPNFPEAHSNLGGLLTDKGHFDEAVAACRRAISLNPGFVQAYSNLGTALKETGRLDEAIAAYRQNIALRPDFPEAHYNLGVALNENGQLDEAIAAYRRAIALDPKFAKAHSNLGAALKDLGELEGAIAAYRQAVALNPDLAETHNNLALSLLAVGNFQQGWEEFKWRWKCRDFQSPIRNFTQPQWDGRPLENHTLLLHAEQGLGDMIQSIRYFPLVAERGGKIIIEIQAELQRLFEAMVGGRCRIIARGQPLPDFDLQCPLFSLPAVFETNLSNIPNTVPYLNPDPQRVDMWQQTLGARDKQLRVGLAWAGNPQFKGDRTRSLNLHQLAPLAAVRGVRFYSLQKGAAGEQAKNPPAGLELVDLGPELKDFADTAAVMSLMDLIVTTDTSVPHLAGALGLPVWVMLQFSPDFRWLQRREDSPWYPTMRLFRQARRGDWQSVITRVADALSREIKNQ